MLTELLVANKDKKSCKCNKCSIKLNTGCKKSKCKKYVNGIETGSNANVLYI